MKKANRAPCRAALKLPRKRPERHGGEESHPRRRAQRGLGGSKTQILELLKRPGGATAKELMKATGWQPFGGRIPFGDPPRISAAKCYISGADEGT
jgi:hypothetical protein